MDAFAEMVAKQAIEEGLYTYCRALDRMDRGLALSIFSPDAQIDYGQWYQGDRDGLVDFLWGMHAPMVTHAHQITNRFIEVLSDDRAVSECYGIVKHRERPDPEHWLDRTMIVRYFDRWSLRDGQWLIDERRGIPDIITEVTRDYVVELDAPTEVSRRDTSDPSYDYFEKRFR